jgi:signal transduction histidine kinase
MLPRPDTLFLRLALTFVVGLGLTIVVTTLVQLPDREAFVFRVSAGRAVQRVVDMVRFVEAATPPSRDALQQFSASQGLDLRFVGQAPAVAAPRPGSDAAAFRQLLAEDLGHQRPLEVQVSRMRLPVDANHAYPRDGFDFNVWTRLADGDWVQLGFQEPQRLPLWPRRLLINILVLAAAMVLLSLVAVRWVTRPLAELSAAAEQLGRDINRPPLPESGPEEVRRAARAFNAMQDRLARYINSRTAVLTAMSHDLKTPITRLRLRAELLEPAAAREKFVHDLGEMEAMVNATLGYMRGLDDREPLRAVDVGALAEALQSDAAELGATFDVHGQPTGPLLGKPQGLKRCLQNLLDNALRYGRNVELVIDDAADRLTLYVRDRGPGIPPDQLERVFEPFYRLETSRNASTGGTGLGLSIARNLAQSMGGELTLRNRPEGGLEAALALPRTGSKVGQEAPGPERRTEMAQPQPDIPT